MHLSHQDAGAKCHTRRIPLLSLLVRSRVGEDPPDHATLSAVSKLQARVRDDELIAGTQVIDRESPTKACDKLI